MVASFTDFLAGIAAIVCTHKVKRIGKIAVALEAVAFPAEVTDIAHSPLPFNGVISLPFNAHAGDIASNVSVAPAFDVAATVATWRYPSVIGALVLTAVPFIVAVISSAGRTTVPAAADLNVSVRGY